MIALAGEDSKKSPIPQDYAYNRFEYCNLYSYRFLLHDKIVDVVVSSMLILSQITKTQVRSRIGRNVLEDKVLLSDSRCHTSKTNHVLFFIFVY